MTIFTKQAFPASHNLPLRHVFSFMVWLYAAVFLANNSAQAIELPNHVDLQTIITTWKQRQETIHAFDLSWSGNYFELVTNDLKNKDVSMKQPEHLNYPVAVRFLMDESGRARYEYDGKKWSSKVGGLLSDVYVDVHDGKTQTTLYQAGFYEFPGGHIKKRDPKSSILRIQIIPILLMYRPFDSVVGLFDPSAISMNDEQGIIDGNPCAILKHKNHTIWVDVKKDCMPVRYIESRDGKTKFSIDISYEESNQHGWVLKRWKDVALSPAGELLRSTEATVNAVRLNPPTDDSLFRIIFPNGTWVHDYDQKKEYIVRGESDSRPIMPGEFTGKNYDQLLNSNPPEKSKLRNLMLINIAAIMALIALAIYFRRLRRTRFKNI